MIVFFNHWHNGDLHVSRTFVKKISRHIGGAVYAHKNDSGLLNDLDVETNPSLLKNVSKEDVVKKVGGDTYVNTWYGAERFRFIKQEEISFSCLYSLFEYSCNKLGFSISDIDQNPWGFFPSIDYTKFHIGRIDKFVKTDTRKKVLICNNAVRSGQAVNFDMNQAIMLLAQTYRDTLWLVTNKTSPVIKMGNVIYTSDVIGKSAGSDLNENSYIAGFCDLVVGRYSGPYTFSYTYNYLFKRGLRYVCFLAKGRPGISDAKWIGNRFGNTRYKSRIISSPETTTKKVVSVVARELQGA